MPRHLTTVTPENIPIEYELAGVASRSGAAIIDILIQVGVILVLVLILGILQAMIVFTAVGWPTTALIIAGFLLWWGYYVYFETAWNGQTPGKRLLRLRVVKYGGTPVDLPSAAIRGLIRAVDIFLFLIGFFVILVTPRNQRLGDIAAGTLVVKERSEWQGDLQQQPQAQPQFSRLPEAELVKNVELVTGDQFQTIKRFVERNAELEPNVRERLAAKIAIPLMEHLGIENRAGILYPNLLSAIYQSCVHDRGMR